MKTIPYKFLIAGKMYLMLMMIMLIGTVSYAQQENTEGIKFPTKFYPILPWDFIDSGDSLKDIADCNFNIAGFIRPYDIHRVEKLHLKAIMNIYFFRNDTEPLPWLWRNLSDEEIDRKVKMLIDSSGNSDAIIGYFLMDEPSTLDFSALGKAVAAVKKYAPGKLAYINLFPNYGTFSTSEQIVSQLGAKTYTEYLERYVNEVKPQFISYDNYGVQLSMDLKDKKNVSYYTNLMDVRRIALKYNLPYWNIVSSNQIDHITTIPSLPNMLFQAYTSLAAGCDGISWYKYTYLSAYEYSPIDNEQNKTLSWYYLKEVNRQISTLGPIMNQLTSTGVYFTSPASDSSLSLLPGKVVESVQSDGPMMIGEFVNDIGTRYIMIVNLSLERSVKFTFSTKTAQEKTWVISATKDGPLMPIMKRRDMDDHKNGLWLTAGEGVLIKVGD